jgi:chemotaxis regulatin CheY-phosphate phosphatase CheZ
MKEHSGCPSLCQVEEAAEKLLGTDSVKTLQDDIEKLCSAIEGITERQRANIDEIDNVSDKFTKEISDATERIVQAVKNLEEKHMDELAKSCKESKSKLEKSIKCFEQRLQYLRCWKRVLQRHFSEEENFKMCSVLSDSKLKHIHENLKGLDYTQLKITVKTTLDNEVQKLTNLTGLAAITTTEQHIPDVMHYESRLKHAEIKKKLPSSRLVVPICLVEFSCRMT